MLMAVIFIGENSDGTQHDRHNREQHHELEKNPKFHIKRLNRTNM
jgi:hypothetical protein